MKWRLVVALLTFGAAAGFPAGARAQTCPANVPHLNGQWATLPYQMPINPISATLMHTGRVLIVSGSENDANNFSPGAESFRNAVWDPTGTTQSSIAVQNIEYDVFCSGVAALPDGRAFVVGGTSNYSFTGENRSSIFDPLTNSFLQSQSMVNGRWYATITTLGDGRVMAWSGINLTGGTNNTVEIYDLTNAGAGWSSPTAAPVTPPLYPRMFVLPGGKVFYTGHGSGGSSANGYVFDPVARTWTISAPTTTNRSYGTAVLLPLLPPTYTPKIMALGGGGNPATSSTETIDLSATTPVWTPGPAMSSGRIQMDAVLLPDGRVLALGGSVNNEAPNGPGKTADLFNPNGTVSLEGGGTASYSRLYHSAALLLPDARVMSIGSNPGGRGSYLGAMEIYTPPYLFDANDQPVTNRPNITGVSLSGAIGYGANFSVSYTSASPIRSAVLVRPGSVTHAFDMEQRVVGLCGPSPQPACSGSGTITLTTPPNGSIAPPGYYMLFLLDSNGVPSKAQFIQLSLYGTAPPPLGAIASPTSDVTIPAGNSVSFSAGTVAPKYSWVFPGGSPGTSTAQNPGNVTFNTPGEYTTSLTVIDATGNSDPSPPTRTITVTPPTANFEIEMSEGSKTVNPNQSTTFTVTVTPLSGFAGTVNLSVGSESGFPTGITSGGFSPATITGGGSSTLTMNTTTATVPYALSLTITGTSGAITHTTSTTLLITLAPPASLTATPGNGQVSLSWPASVGATGYHVKRATVSGGPYFSVGCTASSTLNLTDTGLTNGTTYFYVVSAAYTGGPNAGGESADSSPVSATPQPAIPPVPTGLTATPGNTQVSLSWTASSGATSYNVKRALNSGGPYTTIFSPTSTSYTNTGLTNGTTYFYVVTAVNASGESGNSSQVSATPQPAIPPVPTGLTATPGNTQVSLSWTASSGATSYNVKRANVSGGPYTTIFSPTSTSYTNTGLTNGTTYFYVVTAVNASGESGNSSQVSATPQSAIPPIPTGLAASAGDAQVSLSWTASTGATSYNVKRATNSGGPYTTIFSPTSTSYTNTGLTNGTTYFYVVTAVNASGESGNSSQVSATPQSAIPPIPTGLAASAGDAQVSLSWTASTGATSYNVKRATNSGGPYTTIFSPTSTSYTNTGLTNGTTYYYVVTAANASGESGNSSQVSATPQSATTPPAAPTRLAVNANKRGRLNLRWTQSITAGVTQNGIYRTSTGTYGATPTVTIPAGTSYQDSALTSGTSYCYVVTAFRNGVESVRSNESCDTVR